MTCSALNTRHTEDLVLEVQTQSQLLQDLALEVQTQPQLHQDLVLEPQQQVCLQFQQLVVVFW